MKKIVALVLAVMMLAAMACTVSASSLEEIKAAGKLVVETEATYPPYEYLDDNGAFAGCDIFLAEQIAAEIGVELVMMDTAFDSIIMDIKDGKGDLGIAAFTVTEERKEKIDFSKQYESSLQLLVVKAGNEDLYATKDALKGLKVGAQMGTVQSQLVESALSDSELFELPTYPELALETVNGNIVGFVVDYAVGMAMVASSDGALEVANFEFSAEEASFGKAAIIAKGNEDLLEVVNVVVDRVTADGSYQAAYDEAVAATGSEG